MYKWLIEWKATLNGKKVIGHEAFKTKKQAIEYEKEANTGGRIIKFESFDEFVAYTNEMMTYSNQTVKILPIQYH